MMIFNFTNKYQFTTKLKMNNDYLEVVNQAKLLGVIVTDDLKWDKNTEYLIKKAHARMELLRKVAGFTASIDDKKNIYILYIRSILEQSSVVWHSSLTQENCDDLERVQKCALRIILGKSFDNYEDALMKADLEPLKDRREALSKKLAVKSLENPKTKNIFPIRDKVHVMEKRNQEPFEVSFANTERFKRSSIPYMQRILNCELKNHQTKIRKPG